MLDKFCFYFLLFIIYSFIGWLMEVVGKLIEKKKFINRGFLIGPYCPIYGWGCITIIILLSKYMNNLVILFIMAIFICSILEYFTSYFMEKIFHARWWDYSKNKFNINGRICLETMIPFGILGCLILYIVNPFIVSKINTLSTNTINLISLIIFSIFVLDNIISFDVILKFKTTMKTMEKDGTEEITKRVKEVLIKRNWLFRRLIKAFPNIKNRKDFLLDIQKRIDRELKNVNDKINDTINKVIK